MPKQDLRESSGSREHLRAPGSLLHMKRKARQQEFGFTNWGGKRRGAGRRPKGERAGVSHARRARLCARHPVLVTMRLRAGLPSLRAKDSHALVRRAFAASSEGEGFRVVEYSVQSNHLHLLVEARGERALSRGMNGLAVRIVRGLQRLWRLCGRLLADRYHARGLSTPRAVRTALVYVMQDARKHGAWIARWPDVYSSGASFDGWKGAWRVSRGAESISAGSAWSVRARTWLLSIGWRRHGLIGVLEAPASGSA
jgi:REP element-mobilizing transposase RayT